MSDDKGRRRVAIIIPKNRTWHWHKKIISDLKQTFDVDVYSNAEKSCYPLILRLWLRFESVLLGSSALVKATSLSATPWRQRIVSDYLFILNLSESTIAPAGAPVLEPQFEGQLDSLFLFAILLAGKNPYISFHKTSQAAPVVASYLAVRAGVSLVRALQFSLSRLVVLANRAACHEIHNSRAAMLAESQNRPRVYSTMLLALFILRFFIDKSFGRLLRQFQFQEHWSVALMRSPHLDFSTPVRLQETAILPDDGRRFYADPFLFSADGQKWLFVEEYDYRSTIGVISVARINNDEESIDVPRPVLMRPYHLSYPFVFGHDGAIYMIPETGANRTVELYKAQAFPFDWVLSRTLIKDVELYDSTLLWHREKWWIFGALVHDGGSAQDELAIFYSDAIEGPWCPHRLNPVKSDCRSARPAGHIIKRGDRLLRPAQDCETDYGSALVWLEIEELTTERFSERVVGRWPPRRELNADGVHTFNSVDELSVIDLRRAIWKLPFRNGKAPDTALCVQP